MLGFEILLVRSNLRQFLDLLFRNEIIYLIMSDTKKQGFYCEIFNIIHQNKKMEMPNN